MRINWVNTVPRGIDRHEASERRRVVSGTEIVEVGFSVSFFAGEFVGAGGGAGDLFPEGEVVHGVGDGSGEAGYQARGA